VHPGCTHATSSLFVSPPRPTDRISASPEEGHAACSGDSSSLRLASQKPSDLEKHVCASSPLLGDGALAEVRLSSRAAALAAFFRCLTRSRA